MGTFLPDHRRDDRGCGRQAAPQVTPAAGGNPLLVLFQYSANRKVLSLRQGRVGGDRLRRCVDRIDGTGRDEESSQWGNSDLTEGPLPTEPEIGTPIGSFWQFPSQRPPPFR